MKLHRLTDLDALWDGEMRGFQVAGQPVLLVKLEGAVHAFEDRCAHQQVPMSEGTLQGDVLICRAHLYEYDARSGQGVNPKNVRLRTYPVQVRDGGVFVDLDGGPR